MKTVRTILSMSKRSLNNDFVHIRLVDPSYIAAFKKNNVHIFVT